MEQGVLDTVKHKGDKQGRPRHPMFLDPAQRRDPDFVFFIWSGWLERVSWENISFLENVPLSKHVSTFARAWGVMAYMFLFSSAKW